MPSSESEQQRLQRQLTLVTDALASDLLSDVQRIVTWCRVWQGLPWNQVGQAAGLSSDAARMQFQAARRKLASVGVVLDDE
jgi:DNA-directed RNA polymerase specialized sigma24 family protein